MSLCELDVEDVDRMIQHPSPTKLVGTRHLMIFSKEYDEEFKPVIGKLRFTYNNLYFIVRVEGIEVKADIIHEHQQATLSLEVNEPGAYSWKQLVYNCIGHASRKLIYDAVHELIYLQTCQRGCYHVH